MMKKLLCGLMVFGCMSGNGMEAKLVNDIVTSPEDRNTLSALVSNVMTNNDRVLEARRLLDAQILPDDEFKSILLYRISGMLYRLSVDIRTRGTSDVWDYVDGAMKGTFGPYD